MVKKAGQPTKYKKEYCDQAYKLCADGGFTTPKLGKFFDVTTSTIKNWMSNHGEFLAAIKSGKDEFDTNKVENSLLKQALGYKTTETTITTTTCTCGAAATVERVTTKRIVVPVSTIFWLKNRNRERWKDIKAQELTGDLNVTSFYTNVPEAE